MKLVGKTFSVVLLLAVQLLLNGCLANYEAAKFSISAADVPPVANESDRYFVVKIEEERISHSDIGQSPPAVVKVRESLQTRYPQWFSSGPNAVPVIVSFRSSAPQSTYMWYTLPLHLLWTLTTTFSLGTVPIVQPVSKMNFWTSLKTGSENATKQCPYSGTTKIVVGNKLTVNDSFFPESRGWHRFDEQRATGFATTRFDVDEKLKLDAFCASVALAVQWLTPEERKALRENNEAWWLDAKFGNKRNRPIAVVKESAPDMPDTPDVRSGRPRIVSQDWVSASRSGEIRFHVDFDTEIEAAAAWLTGEYLPEYCRTLGIVVSADDPASAPLPAIRVGKPEKMPDETFVMRFSVGE